MNLENVRKLKCETETEIQTAIAHFMIMTGLAVYSVDFLLQEGTGGNHEIFNVKMDVRVGD